MKTVYWSPFFTSDEYPATQLIYNTPVPLLSELLDKRNSDNKGDNFYQCHAFLNSIKNTFVLKIPFDIVFALDEEIGPVYMAGNPLDMRFVALKKPSHKQAFTFAIRGNWIFWSEDDLDIITSPAHYHKSFVDGFYVGGRFNIGKWFRPIEGATQLNQGVNTVSIKKNDAVAYVKFETDEPVQLKRFYMTKELEELSWACVHYKYYNKSKGLSYLYNKFKHRGMDKIITRLIKENEID
jgi:hypothetical protein